MKFRILFLAILFITTYPVSGQIFDPVNFKVEQYKISEDKLELKFTTSIEDGWHLYSINLPADGPSSTELVLENISGLKTSGGLSFRGKEIDKYDDVFEMNLRYFENNVVFYQVFDITAKEYSADGYLIYSACDDESCLPPTEVPFRFEGKSALAAPAVVPQSTDENLIMPEEDPDENIIVSEISNNPDYWKPVTDQISDIGDTGTDKTRTWIFILLAGFAGGFLALLTPCVWPIIPMTVSYFLKKETSRRKSIRDAVTYGISIIIIYVGLGLLITLIFGASALNALSTNAFFNILFFLMLVVFAISFFGAFEIRLPSSWSTKVDSKVDGKSGFAGIFLMAFTLALVSFSCTGPIIGFLLVEVSTTNSILSPALGMLGFAVALALPFTLFALFPQWLKSAPRSGGWMNTVKVTLGFIELAFALKFLSVADLAYGWGILDREVFLSLWIVIFALLGIYLLGKIKFPHDDDSSKVGVPKFMLALLSFSFAIYMVPGLWGAPLKSISAFAPPLYTQDFNLYNREVHAQFDDYDLGMEYARRNKKPVMLDFTGYGCVNCRKMELAVWTDPRVSSIINDKYVLITLYVDNKTPLEEPIYVDENGKSRRLRTVGDKWSYLQRIKFGYNAQPFYVLLNNDGDPLTTPYYFDENIDKYVRFLNDGLANYR